MLDLQQLQDGGSVIGDRDVSHIVHHHLVQANRAEAALDDVGDTGGGQHVLCPDGLATGPLALQDEGGLRCGHPGDSETKAQF